MFDRFERLLVAMVLVAVAGCHRQMPTPVDATPLEERLDGLRIVDGPPGERQRGVSWVAGPEPVTGADFAPLARTGVSWIVDSRFRGNVRGKPVLSLSRHRRRLDECTVQVA